jgi:hypothetical protein
MQPALWVDVVVAKEVGHLSLRDRAFAAIFKPGGFGITRECGNEAARGISYDVMLEAAEPAEGEVMDVTPERKT